MINKPSVKLVDCLRIIEGSLFLQGESGIDAQIVQTLFNCNKVTAKKLLISFVQHYNSNISNALVVKKLGNIFKFVTKSIDHDFYQKLHQSNIRKRRMSQASLETLAIIAYKRPVTRIQIEHIRGVASDSILRKLVARDLIREVGRSNTPGNPILYSVTNAFMDTFDLMDLKSLPEIPSFNTAQTELNLFDKII